MAASELEEVEFLELIGHGSFCQVELCRRNGQSLAAKRVVKTNAAVEQAIRMEAHCLRRLASDWVVQFLYEIDTPAQWIAILELCESELWEEIKHCGCVAPEEFAWYGRQMAKALQFVHGLGIAHRDVKCENFLLTKEKAIKLIDFGTARDFQHPEVATMMLGPQYEHHVGTPNFMSPEAIDGKANDRHSDLWSLGCAYAQLLLGVAPFHAPTPFLTLTKAQAGQLWLPSQVQPMHRQLMEALLQKEPHRRLGAEPNELLAHPALAAAQVPARSAAHCAVARLGRALMEEVEAALAAQAAAQEAAQWGEAVEVPQAQAPAREELPNRLAQELEGELREALQGKQPRQAELQQELLELQELLGRCWEVAAQRIQANQETLDLGSAGSASSKSEDSELAEPQPGPALPEETTPEVEVKPTRCCVQM